MTFSERSAFASEPIAFWCGHCRSEFEAVDAVKDTNEEGTLLLCPYCGSESLQDLHETEDEPEIDDKEWFEAQGDEYHDWNTG